jgi:hypothetical protein
MQGSNHNSNFPDPTNPNFLNASAHGRPDFGRAGVAAIGNTGEQQQQQQSQNFPPLPQNVSQQLLLRAANNNGALQKVNHERDEWDSAGQLLDMDRRGYYREMSL